MKQSNILLALAIFAFYNCSDSTHEKAKQKLDVAQQAYNSGAFKKAKQEIDSIKLLYPKEFEVREKSQLLLLDVELNLQQENIDSLTTLQKQLQQEFNKIKKNYVFEKNAKYQTVGNYFWPTQTVERNLTRSFVRFQVNELGKIAISSIYNGKSYIHHNAIELATKRKSIDATTSSSRYESENLGNKKEECSYDLEETKHIIQFISSNVKERIALTFKGGKKNFKTTLTAGDKKAATEIDKLAKILQEQQSIKQQIEESRVKIEFINHKKDKNSSATSQE